MTTLLPTRPTTLQMPATKAKAKACPSVNPFDGKILKAFEELTNPQLKKAMNTAATCFEDWRPTTFAKRPVIVPQLANLMRDRVEEFSKLL